MMQPVAPIAVRPWTLNGMSEHLIVSHYENNYGGGVRTLNAVRAELAALDARAPGYRVRALKREELAAANSVALHELYFGNLGGEGNKIPAPIGALLEEHFGSAAGWRREFVGAAQALAGGSGWVLLSYLPRDRRLINQFAAEHSQAISGGIPILALDIYEHAYHIDFGANAKAYIDTYMRNIDWKAVEGRYDDASHVAPPRPLQQPEFGDGHPVLKQSGGAPFPWCVRDDIALADSVTLFDAFASGGSER
jgi:Fe-Mn family superoxide dismutase